MRPLLPLLALALVPLAPPPSASARAGAAVEPGAPPPNAAGEAVDFAERYHERGVALLEKGELDLARAAFERVLEREPRRLATLWALARLERGRERQDDALWFAGHFLDTWRHLERPPRELRAAEAELRQLVRAADPLRRELDERRRRYVGELLKLAERQMDRRAWHSARTLLGEARGTDPEHPELAAGLARIRAEGGNELAVEDEAGGADPLADVAPEWIDENDPKHASWESAWELETENYTIRTNAGYRVLKVVAAAMEQVNGFYREFHGYATDGGSIPRAGVHIYRDAQEYKTLGGAPTDWAGGHWDGRKVVTYDHRGGGAGALRDTLQTLFHEASHQFTTLAGGGAVPAWLNEGMASFFEGTRLLSNGQVEWNLIATGRLYPLVEDLRSDAPHRLADVITGQVDDYRIYYPWGWGIVYYLYNAESDGGELLYRHLLREYFREYRTQAHVERFTEFFVTRAAVPGVASLADFERRFVEHVFRLEAEDKGELDGARADEAKGDACVAREDWARAIELYDRSLRRDPDHPDVLWKLAGALEAAGEDDRAVGTLRQWLTVNALRADAGPRATERRTAAAERIEDLDSAASRLARLRERYHADALELAGRYEELGFPRVALSVLRGPATAQPPSEVARERYFAISDRTGIRLESWRLLFNERDLEGFYGGGEGAFSVEDGVIVARLGTTGGAAASRTGERASDAGRTFAFRRLFVDCEPAGDWSLSAQVRFGGDSRMAGLCFGKKADGEFHGLALLPSGHVDLSRFTTDGETLYRTSFGREGEWTEVEIDVAGTRLEARVNGKTAILHEFPTRAALRGDFGLLAGTGTVGFREIRLLEYDPELPRREAPSHSEGAGGGVAPGDALEPGELPRPARAPAGELAYVGKAPPALRVSEWIGEPPGGGDLDELVGWPVLLVFWTTYQEGTLPVLPALARLEERFGALDVPVLLVTDEERGDVERWLRSHSVPYPVGVDWPTATYTDYSIKTHGLPRALLLDPAGRVVWEGNPDFHPDHGSYVDEPFAELVRRARLEELVAAGEVVSAAESAFERGELSAAAAGFRKVAEIDVVHPAVLRAKAGLERLEREGARRLAAVDALVAEGRLLQAAAECRELAAALPGTDAGGAAPARLADVEGRSAHRAARALENRLVRAEKYVLVGRTDPAKRTLEGTLEKHGAADDPWIRERAEWLLAALADAGADKGGEALFARYRERFPRVRDPRAED